jgi:N-acyl-D-aspartate/D-glutamate deacylase
MLRLGFATIRTKFSARRGFPYAVCMAWFLCTEILLTSACAEQYDILITSGLVYDGSLFPARTADIGINDGLITAVGRLESNAQRIIDANGLIVAPGFIDIHTHATFSAAQIPADEAADIQSLASRRPAKNYLFQGVTTVVSGNCGDGPYEVRQVFEDVRRDGAGVNLMLLIGHGTVREAVMGMANAAPTRAQMARMKRLLRRGMEEGAVGMSTGLYYAPGNYAKTREIIELAKVVAEYDGIYATHMRDEGIGLLDAIEEAIEIGRQARVPVQISHLKVFGRHAPGVPEQATDLIEAARSKGITVFADQYPYLAGSTRLAALVLQPWVRADGPEMMLNRLNDPSLATRIRTQAAELIHQLGGPQAFVIAHFASRPAWQGRNIKQISQIIKTNATEAALEILRIGNPQMVVFAMTEDDLRHFMSRPYVMTASDSWNPPYGVGLYHPRNYGTFAHKIRHYVLDEGVITMQAAICAATSLPAQMLHLDDRGRIGEGLVADIVVFDPRRISGPATYEKPHQYSRGAEYVLVNGALAIDAGRHTGAMAGRPLRLNRSP